jgi:hypothetical protein
MVYQPAKGPVELRHKVSRKRRKEEESEMSSKTSRVTRRKFLKTGAVAAGAATIGTMAMPQVSRAQTVNFKYQSTWPTKDIFHEFAVDMPSTP